MTHAVRCPDQREPIIEGTGNAQRPANKNHGVGKRRNRIGIVDVLFYDA